MPVRYIVLIVLILAFFIAGLAQSMTPQRSLEYLLTITPTPTIYRVYLPVVAR